jgi:hypothetical protein
VGVISATTCPPLSPPTPPPLPRPLLKQKQNLTSPPGFETTPVSYGTDIPHLHGNHKRYLYGPGSILVAHSDSESLAIQDLQAAVKGYKRLVRESLNPSSGKGIVPVGAGEVVEEKKGEEATERQPLAEAIVEGEVVGEL